MVILPKEVNCMEKNLILDYCKAAQTQMDATYSGDYKKGNRAADKLYKYNDFIKSDFQNYKSAVKELLNSQNPNVVIWIANVALDKEFETDFVVTCLKNIAQDKNLGIISFNAEMTLKTRNLV